MPSSPLSGRSRLLACAIVMAVVLSAPVAAQQGAFSVGIASAGPALGTVPAMISILRAGDIVSQNEVILGYSSTTGWTTPRLAVGVYDVRVEAEGLATEVKRGVRILDGQTANVAFLVRPGKGVHIVEYATGGLAREEVAARLAVVEATLAKLQRDPTEVAVSPSDQRSEMRTTGVVKWFDVPRVLVTAIDPKTGIVTALDSATNRSFQFRAASAVVVKLAVGQKVWANFETQKVSVDGNTACCTMAVRQ